MPPNTVNTTTSDNLQTEQQQERQQQNELEIEDYSKYKNTIHTLYGYFDQPLRWPIIIHILTYHILALIGLITFPYFDKKLTLLWNYVLGVATIFGITAGVHRLWTHRAYKAILPLKVILAICYTLSGHYSIYHWVRDHRVHHKYSDTEADPFNVNRGFFYAQIGFLFLKKHPAVLKKAAGIDSRDLLNDPVIRFFKKHYWPMQLIFHFLLPIGIPVYFWNESLYWSILISSVRFVVCLHITTAVNSVAHQFGTKPYDKRHKSVENMIYSIFALGEGWHNYHHAFPWDYKAEEFGRYTTNFTTFMLDLFGKLGWAYDFKTASPELVKKFTMKHGDGTHPFYSGGDMEIKEFDVDHDSARW